MPGSSLPGWSSPQTGGRRRLTAGWAVWVVSVVTMGSFVSSLQLELGTCYGDGGTPYHPKAAATVVCKAADAGSVQAAMLIAPIVLAVLGVVLGFARRDRRFTIWGTAAAAALLLLPWVVLAVLVAWPE